MENTGTLKNPIKLDFVDFANGNFFGTKRDFANDLLNKVIEKAYDNEFNDDGSHNFYDTIHIHSDKILLNFFEYLVTCESSFNVNDNDDESKDGVRNIGIFNSRFHVNMVYDSDRKNLIRLTCSADENKEDNAIYAEIIW